MSTLVDTAIKAFYKDGFVTVHMESGVEIKFPVKNNRRFAKGTNDQLNNIEISPYGLHWPDLDEDLSFSGLFRGDYGQFVGNREKRKGGCGLSN